MCTVLVNYDKRNKVVSQFLNALSMIKGVEIDFNFKQQTPKNKIDIAIEDIKNGRVTTCENVEEFKKAMRRRYNYV